MKEITKQDIDALVLLQEAETEIVRLQSVLTKVDKEKARLEVKLAAFEAALVKNRAELEKTSEMCLNTEEEVKVIDQRIIKSNETLRMVKTNKEYQVLLREVDDNKKRKDALETELLEMMEEKEKQTAVVEESEKEFALLKEQTRAAQADLEQQTTDDKASLDEYGARQAEIGQALDSFLMDRFKKISKMNDGLAVARVNNETCMGCFMNIPPQLYIEVQRGTKLISCPQCSRILYYAAEA